MTFDEDPSPPVEFAVASREPIFISKWIWKRRCILNRPTSSIREFEKDCSNLMFIDGDGYIEFKSSTYSVYVDGGSFFCTKPDRGYNVDIHPTEGSSIEVLHFMVPTSNLPPPIHCVNPMYTSAKRLGPDWDLIKDIADRLFESAPALQPSSIKNLAFGLLGSIASCLHEEGVEQGRRATSKAEHAERIENYIDSNLSHADLSASVICKDLGISTRYLSEVLRHSGTALPKLINQKRVRYAKRLLGDRTTSVASMKIIATLCGFRSYARFYQVFTDLEGAPPGDVRETLQRTSV